MITKPLLQQYQTIMDNPKAFPSWAKKKKHNQNEFIKCTIPFVGKNYFCHKPRILVYASAENLTKYTGEFDRDGDAVNRHRAYFDDPKKREDRYFPSIHLQPFDDGSLATAVLYIATKLFEIPCNISPAVFYEQIAIGNYCKYTIESDEKNIDYATDAKKLSYSRSFIEADIAFLKPDVIIMPKSIYKSEKSFVDTIKGSARVIPISQINSGTINRTISKKNGRKPKRRSDLAPCVKTWYDNLCENGISGDTKENYLYVFSYIDEELDKENRNILCP